MLIQQIKSLVKTHREEVLSNRRHIHAYPELSFQEHKTARFVSEKLQHYGLSPQEGVAGTGLTALIEGKNPTRKTIALRADMDALPIHEANEIPYRSKYEGIMHACGHDVHTSCLIGVANILNQLKSNFEGTVKLIFQPGEERMPGGASLMIKDGVLKNPAPQSIIGQHVMPYIPVGKVGFREGMYMASCDEIQVTVSGKGGHAAIPETLVDPVLITAHILVALQQIVSRVANPKIPSVLSFGDMHAHGATNIIPNEVKLQGTFRTMNEKWREKARCRMKKMAEGIAQSMGGKCDFNIVKGYPYLVNEPKLTQRAKAAATAYMGKENIIDLDLWMAAEDFSFYSQQVFACFYRLGTRNEAKGIVSGLHTPTFDIDEEALEIGVGLMTWLALAELNSI